MQKRLAALGLTVGLVGGGAAGLALGVPGLSSAQSSGTDSTTTTPPTTAAGSGSAPATPAKPDASQRIKDILAPLVTKGTITQAQADAVAQALQDAKPAFGPGHGGGPGPGGHFGRGFGGMGLDTAAKAIGVTTDELRTAIESGQSIADFAKSKNVDVKTVVDALVAEAKAGLDKAVTDGKLTQAQADTELTEATQRITDLVNGTLPAGGPGGPGGPGGFGGHRDHGGPDGDNDGGNGTTPSTPSTTTG